MKKTTLPTSLKYLAAALTVGLLAANVEADNPSPAVRQYLAAKGVHFNQSGAGVPALSTNQPYEGMLSVEPASPTSVTSVSVQIPVPGGTSVTLTTNEFDSQWQAKESFATKAALDAAAPPGSYRFTIIAFDGTHMPTLTLTGDAYPNTPHLANWAALQHADASGDILITWDAFNGGTTNDFVQFRVEDGMGNGFKSGENPGQPGALNGTNTSIVIPADTLRAGSNYSGSLLFARANINTTAYPAVSGLTAYFKETQFSLSTTSAPPAAGRFRFAESAYTVSEDGLGIVLTVVRSGGSSGAASVLVTTREGTAVAGINYASLSTRVQFGDGVESVNLPLIPIVDHSTLDGKKTFFATLSAPSGGADIGLPAEATVTILDTEIRGVGTLGFSAPMYMALESASNVAVTVTRTGGASGVVAVVYTTIAGSAEAGRDYASSEGMLTFSNGVTAQVINVRLFPDGTDETNETFTVALFNPTGGAALSVHNTAIVVLKDDDTAGTLSFSDAMYSVVESETNFPVIVRRAGGNSDEVSVDLILNGGTATRGVDYDHNGGTTVTLRFGPGQKAVTNFFAIHDDHEAEGDETILLSLRNPGGGARLAARTNATLKILDDEVTLQFSASDYTNKETAGAAILFVERVGPLKFPASVSVRTSGGTARPGVDYVATNIVVNFPAGAKKKPVAIRLINDFLVEIDETIGLVLEDPSANANLGPRDSATIHIVSEDRGGVIQFAASNFDVRENRAFLPVLITRTEGHASNVTVHLQTSEMSARDGEDYIGTNTTLTFATGENRKLVLIPILSDTLVEGLETFLLHLTNPTGGASLGSRSEAMAVILDDDAGGVISFARPEIIVKENETNAVVIVKRTGGDASEVKVRLTAANGTAGDADYGSFNRVLTFAAGEHSKTNLISIINDTDAEGAIPETILLTLSQFQGGGRPGLSNAVIRIVDDESSVSFASSTATAVEGKVFSVAVARAGALGTQVTVDYVTMGGTATAGSDFLGTTGTLTFPPGVALRLITIPIPADANRETNDNFSVVLRNPQGGLQLGIKSSVLVTIQDVPDAAAVPLAGPEFFKLVAVGVTNSTFRRAFTASTDIHAVGLGGSNYNIIGTTVRSAIPEIASLTVSGLTGPGSYVFTSTGPSDAGYINGLSPTFAFGTHDPGDHGTILIDGFDGTRVSGRFDMFMTENADETKFIHVTGSFRAIFVQ